ncbi:hypothetical protein [Enterococcus sp. LJL90]
MAIRTDFRKRKIRGWKRRLEEIERWKYYCIKLDKNQLEKYSRDYVKLLNLSFYSLREYTIPNWYKRRILKALVEVYDSWRKSLEQLDEPHYLKIWVFKKDFLHSQVVVSYRDMLHYYDKTFAEIEPSTLPSELAIKETDQFSWQQGLNLGQQTENELLEDIQIGFSTEEEAQAIRDGAYAIERQEKDTSYVMLIDQIWIGERSI